MSDQPALHRRLKDLLLERSVRHGSFILASGRRSTFYIDARLTTMCGEGLALIGQLGLHRLTARGWQPPPRAIGGLTLGADPVAYAIARAAHDAGVPLDAFTVRKQAKDHGTGKRIEGCFHAGDPVIVVEDVITSGASARDAITVVEGEGGRVLGVLAIVDRQEGGREALAGAGYDVDALFTAGELGLDVEARYT